MHHWQEINTLRSTAVRLVSHLAQVPSSAVHFKDVLLSMPAAHRQQLQVSFPSCFFVYNYIHVHYKKSEVILFAKIKMNIWWLLGALAVEDWRLVSFDVALDLMLHYWIGLFQKLYFSMRSLFLFPGVHPCICDTRA